MTHTDKTQKAQRFAHEAHEAINQRRKYSGLPYWVHVDEVAEIVAFATGDENAVAAAFLHDVVEDVFPVLPYYSVDTIRAEFGDRVAGFVFDLTDQYTKENYPQWNRKIRKMKERERLGAVAAESKTIKLADLLSNTADIMVNDRDFANLYIREKDAMLPYLVGGNAELWARARAQCDEALTELNLN